MPIQGCGVFGLPETPTQEVQLDHYYITLLSWEFLLNRYNFL